MSALANAAILVAILLCGLSGLLAVVGYISWRRVGHNKLAWVAFAFTLFSLQGAYLIRDFYLRRGEIAGGWDALPSVALVNLLIVIALYMAVLKR